MGARSPALPRSPLLLRQAPAAPEASASGSCWPAPVEKDTKTSSSSSSSRPQRKNTHCLVSTGRQQGCTAARALKNTHAAGLRFPVPCPALAQTWAPAASDALLRHPTVSRTHLCCLHGVGLRLHRLLCLLALTHQQVNLGPHNQTDMDRQAWTGRQGGAGQRSRQKAKAIVCHSPSLGFCSYPTDSATPLHSSTHKYTSPMYS